MDKQTIEAEICSRLDARKKKVLNHNAVSALFGAFDDPVGALGKIFVGRQDALDAEKQKIAQEVVLELLCKIDDAITAANEESRVQGITVNGLIETSAHGGESVVGVEVADSAVVFEPGTHIRTTGIGSRRVTGLKVGGRSSEE